MIESENDWLYHPEKRPIGTNFVDWDDTYPFIKWIYCDHAPIGGIFEVFAVHFTVLMILLCFLC